MDINKYINNISKLNSLLEQLTYTGVDSNIGDLSKKIDDLESRMDRYSNRKNLPYSEIKINFKNKVTLTVRSADEKEESIFEGRQTFDVIGFTDKFFVLTKKDWDYKIGLKLTYQKLETYLEQTGDIKLFYNKYGELSNGIATRSSMEEEIKYEIVKLVK